MFNTKSFVHVPANDDKDKCSSKPDNMNMRSSADLRANGTVENLLVRFQIVDGNNIQTDDPLGVRLNPETLEAFRVLCRNALETAAPPRMVKRDPLLQTSSGHLSSCAAVCAN